MCVAELPKKISTNLKLKMSVPGSEKMEIVNQKENHVDESLYSRQLYVFGHEAQQRMAKSDILLLGLNGLGVEIAKNIILSGVKSVTLYDNTLTTISDLSSQFYLSEEMISIPRARATQPKLAELNPYVHVALLEGELTLEHLRNYAVVVVLETALELQIQYSSFCHDNGICFVAADSFGVFGNVFCDFGHQFVVNDTTGEPAETSIIASITLLDPANTDGIQKALVTVLEEGAHGLYSGDTVIMTHIQCDTSLNGAPMQVAVKDRFSFEVSLEGHTWPFPIGTQYLRGGYIAQVKQPAVIDFEPLAAKLDAPGYITSLITKEGDHASALHLGFRSPFFLLSLSYSSRALHEYKKIHSALPEPGNLQHAQELFSLASELNTRISLVRSKAQTQRDI
jgi:ubiquitin-activating enzyme E1